METTEEINEIYDFVLCALGVYGKEGTETGCLSLAYAINHVNKLTGDMLYYGSDLLKKMVLDSGRKWTL